MNRKVADDASTRAVVWEAAERIGKASSTPEINRICDYLINKHWFQTAGDLRVARENVQEWQTLEVPGRLKIAIQDVLDAPEDLSLTTRQANHEEVKEVDCLDDTHQDSVSSEYNAGYDLTNAYSYDFNAAAASSAGEYPGTDQEQETEATAAARLAAWEAYYAAHGYYSYPGDAVDDYSRPQEACTALDPYENTDIVEAQEVVVEDAVAAELVEEEETNLAPTESYPPVKATWSCGQCTYDNSADVSFCEMCFGHISLSPDSLHFSASIHREDTPNGLNAEFPGPIFQSYELTPPSVETLPRPALATTDLPGPPLFVSIPCPSPPLSPVYSPSAPDFEDAPPDEIEQTSSEAEWNIGARRLSPPVQEPPPVSSPPKIDYCALAFKRVPSFRGDSGVTKASEERTPTEFTF